MLERVIENWLDSSSERSFQRPFCYMLAAEGYTILHLTRHCGLEAGKDILAIDPNGIPCAFQLKSARRGKINLAQYRKEIQPQLHDLFFGPIIHPSIEHGLQHRSYLVTNGEFEEEVIRAIDDFNRKYGGNNQYGKIRTIVRGELLRKASKLEEGLWPVELKDIRTLLELFLDDGLGLLPKEKLANLFQSVLPFEKEEKGKPPSGPYCRRAISGSGVLCAIAISKFSENKNHSAEIEAWIIYLSYVFGLVEKWNLKPEFWEQAFKVSFDIIFNLLKELSEEVLSHETHVEGNPIVDAHFFNIRMTYLIALISIFALWLKKEPDAERKYRSELKSIKNFVLEKKKHLSLWGEAAIPQFLAFYWYYRMIDATPKPDFLIGALINTICNHRKYNTNSILANPYYELEKIVPIMLKLTNEPLEESFEEISYFLEGLVHIFVRRNWKQEIKSLWPSISHFSFMRFETKEKWQFFKWRCENGISKQVMCKHKKNWNDLKQEALESKGECIPDILKKKPILLLLMMVVYPHRMNSEIVRWLDTVLSSN